MEGGKEKSVDCFLKFGKKKRVSVISRDKYTFENWKLKKRLHSKIHYELVSVTLP